jgi:hypothetical protein
MRSCWLVFIVCALLALPASAAAPATPYQVFVQRNVDGAGSDRLIFIDLLTGEETTLNVDGQRYTPFGDAVMYHAPATGEVMLADPDGTRKHPFIQPESDTRRVDWLVSPDGTEVAWTLTSGTPDFLTTVTQVAAVDGSGARVVLRDGARTGIRALPVAFAPDMATLYMDYQPDMIGDLTPFRQYAGLFAVDLATGGVSPLPGEPGCFCGAAVGAGHFLRLSLTPDLTGFDLRMTDLASESETRIPALRLVDFTQAGDVLIAPDGARAVYALAQVQNFGRPEQAVRTVFVLVDLDAGTQSALTEPITTFVRPVAWTEDATAILFTSPTLDGTWKVNLSDGLLNRVAEATYVGTIR